MVQELIKDDNYLNIYRFGSHVYGTNNENSDEDFICIVKNKIPAPDINIHLYTENEFQKLLDNHNIQMMECYFLPHDTNLILKKTVGFTFTLDKSKLRHAISTVSNGSWIKCKKKLTVQADYDKYLAIKSLFHSLRILSFGIDIAKNGQITDYKKHISLWKFIQKITKDVEYNEAWDILEDIYKNIFNDMKKEFSNLCPLGYDKNDKKRVKLIELLKSYNIVSESLTESIYEIFIKSGKQ